MTLGLLNLSGCAGGFQGYRPVALTVTRPASITVPLGQTATFSVSATGTGTMSYQWFKNGVAIMVPIPVRTPPRPLSLATQVRSLLLQ